MSGKWIDVDITESKEAQPLALANGMLTINLDKNSVVEQPKYYTHFTIARFEKGKYITLDYEDSPTLSKFPATLELPEGLYRIVTGNRHKSGTVTCSIYHVKVEGGKKLQFTLTIPSTKSEKKVLGSISTDVLLPITENPKTIEQIANGQPAVIAIIDPLAEPTRHLLGDISTHSNEFSSRGNAIALIVAKGKTASKLDLAAVFDGKPYPSNIVTGIDEKGELEGQIGQAIGEQQLYPIVLVVNSNGEIVFHSAGYSINLGEQLLAVLKQ